MKSHSTSVVGSEQTKYYVIIHSLFLDGVRLYFFSNVFCLFLFVFTGSPIVGRLEIVVFWKVPCGFQILIE